MDKPPIVDIDYWVDDPTYEVEPLEFDMHCPKIKPKYNGDGLNWTVEQCKLRLELRCKCTKNCSMLDELRRIGLI